MNNLFNRKLSNENNFISQNIVNKPNGTSNTPFKLKETGNSSSMKSSNLNYNISNLPSINKNVNMNNINTNSNYDNISNSNHFRFNSSILSNSNGNSNSNFNYQNQNSFPHKNSYSRTPYANENISSNLPINLKQTSFTNDNKNNNLIGGIGTNRIPSSNLSNSNSNNSNYNSIISNINNQGNVNNSNVYSNSNVSNNYNLSSNRLTSRNNSNSHLNISANKNENIYVNNNSIFNSHLNHNKNSSYSNYDSTTKNVFVISRKLIGLNNLGNTCFMNTSLQCILHCESFILRFLEIYEIQSSKNIRKTPVSTSLYKLIESYSKAPDKSAISPEDLKNAMSKKHKIYSGYSQQDSQEFIRKLLDEISQELNLVTEKKPYRLLNPNDEQENKIELSSEYDKIFRDRENSIIVDTFYGQSISIFKCLFCKYESYSYEKFLDIPLLLDETYSDQDISKLLFKHFQSENIQWEIPCPNKSCKRKSMHSKELKLSLLPDILILSLQRYNHRLRRKNNCKVNFKEEIDLKEYTDSSFLNGIY
jgi:ubiquitin C-terminal hydrolase